MIRRIWQKYCISELILNDTPKMAEVLYVGAEIV